MFGNFTEESRKILMRAKKEMNLLKHPYVGSEHLLLAILSYDNEVSRKLKTFNLDYKRFRTEILDVVGEGSTESSWFLYTPLLNRVLKNAMLDSKENNNGEVTVEHLFSSLLEEGEGVAIRILIGMNIDIDELYSEFTYRLETPKKKKKTKKLLVEELGTDLTKLALQNELDPVIGRDNEIKRLLEILSRRTKNNPVLIGEAGVGKTAIVEELSRLIAIGEVPMGLKNKRIINLDMATLVAGTKYRGEFEDRIRKVLKEVEENDDIILFIDEIHTLVGAGGAEGAIDASNIFKPALARGKVRCIGATTTLEYKKYIEKDGALERRFQKVVVDIPDTASVKNILMRLKTVYEQYHFVEIDEEVIDLIISLSSRYIYDRNDPDKTIDVMDEVCARVSLKESKDMKKYNKLRDELKDIIKRKNEAIIRRDFDEASHYKDIENKIMNDVNSLELKLYSKEKKKKVTKDDIYDVIAQRTKIPVQELMSTNFEQIEKIKSEMKEKIIGQDNAIDTVIKVMKKIKFGFAEGSRPCSLMFVGPTGVGKTELSKIFGKYLVGENNIIRLDMSEYAESSSVSKLIGANPGYVGYEDNKNILEEIRNKPYSLLILDEIEKAHPSIIHLLYQILDEGKIKDSVGREIRFDHVTIVMTSNIGFDDIHVGFNPSKEETAISKLKENFSLPFINRIDHLVVFNSLTEESMMMLIEYKFNELLKKYKNNIILKIQDGVKKELCDLSGYKEFGARKLERLIQDKLENVILDTVLTGKKQLQISSITKLTTV